MSADNLVACRKCSTLVIRNRAELSPGKKAYRYRDERGRRWDGHFCPKCKKHRNNPTPDPTAPVDERAALGRANEHIACAWWNAHHPDDRAAVSAEWNGPDLTTASGLRIEVKTAVHSHRGRCKTEKVYPRRREDHFVIAVHDGRCSCAPMSEHLAACGSGGKRKYNITALATMFTE